MNNNLKKNKGPPTQTEGVIHPSQKNVNQSYNISDNMNNYPSREQAASTTTYNNNNKYYPFATNLATHLESSPKSDIKQKLLRNQLQLDQVSTNLNIANQKRGPIRSTTPQINQYEDQIQRNSPQSKQDQLDKLIFNHQQHEQVHQIPLLPHRVEHNSPIQKQRIQQQQQQHPQESKKLDYFIDCTKQFINKAKQAPKFCRLQDNEAEKALKIFQLEQKFLKSTIDDDELQRRSGPSTKTTKSNAFRSTGFGGSGESSQFQSSTNNNHFAVTTATTEPFDTTNNNITCLVNQQQNMSTADFESEFTSFLQPSMQHIESNNRSRIVPPSEFPKKRAGSCEPSKNQYSKDSRDYLNTSIHNDHYSMQGSAAQQQSDKSQLTNSQDISQQFQILKKRIKEVEKQNVNILSKLHFFNEIAYQPPNQQQLSIKQQSGQKQAGNRTPQPTTNQNRGLNATAQIDQSFQSAYSNTINNAHNLSTNQKRTKYNSASPIRNNQPNQIYNSKSRDASPKQQPSQQFQQQIRKNNATIAQNANINTHQKGTVTPVNNRKGGNQVSVHNNNQAFTSKHRSLDYSLNEDLQSEIPSQCEEQPENNTEQKLINKASSQQQRMESSNHNTSLNVGRSQGQRGNQTTASVPNNCCCQQLELQIFNLVAENKTMRSENEFLLIKIDRITKEDQEKFRKYDNNEQQLRNMLENSEKVIETIQKEVKDWQQQAQTLSAKSLEKKNTLKKLYSIITEKDKETAALKKQVIKLMQQQQIGGSGGGGGGGVGGGIATASMQDNVAQVISEMEEALGARLRQMEQALVGKDLKIKELEMAVNSIRSRKEVDSFIKEIYDNLDQIRAGTELLKDSVHQVNELSSQQQFEFKEDVVTHLVNQLKDLQCKQEEMQISLENAQKLGNTDQVQELQELLQFLDQEIEETVLRLTSFQKGKKSACLDNEAQMSYFSNQENQILQQSKHLDLQKLQTENENLSKKIQNLSGINQKQEETIAIKNELCQKLEKQMAINLNQNPEQSHKQQIQQLNQKIVELQADKQKQQNLHQSQLQDLVRRIQKIGGKLGNSSQSALNNNVATLSPEDAIGFLENSIQAMLDEKRRTNEEHDSAEKSIKQQFQNKIDKLNQELEKKNLDFNNCQSICIQLVKDNDVLKQQAKSLMNELENQRNSVATSLKQNQNDDQLMKLLNSKSSEIVELQQQLLKIKADNEIKIQASNDLVAQAQQQAKFLSDENKNKVNQLEKFFEESAKYNEKLKQLLILSAKGQKQQFTPQEQQQNFNQQFQMQLKSIVEMQAQQRVVIEESQRCYAQITALREEKGKIQEYTQILVKENSQLKEEIKLAEKNRQHSQEGSNRVKEQQLTQVDELKKLQNALQEQLQQVKVERDRIFEENTIFKKRLSTESKELENLQNQLIAAKKELSDVKEQLSNEKKNNFLQIKEIQKLKEEKIQLDGKLESLKKDNDILKSQDSEEQMKQQFMEMEIKKVNSELEQQIQVIQQEKDKLEQIYINSVAEKENADVQLEELREQMQATIMANQAQEQEKNNLINQFSSLQQQYEGTLEEYERLKKELITHLEFNSKLKQDLQVQTEEIASMKQQLDQQKEEIVKKNEQATKLNLEVLRLQDILEQSDVNQKIQVQTIFEENSQLHQQISELNQQLNNLQQKDLIYQEQTDQTTQKLNGLEQQIQQVVGDLNQSREEVSKLSEANLALQEENQKLNQHQEQQEQELMNIQNQNTIISDENKQISQQNSTLKQSNMMLTQENKSLSQQNGMLYQKNVLLQSDYNNLSQANDILQQEINSIKMKAEQLEQENYGLKSSSTNQISQLQENLSQYKQELEHNKSSLEQAYQESLKLEQIIKEKDQIQLNYTQLLAERESLLSQLEKATQQQITQQELNKQQLDHINEEANSKIKLINEMNLSLEEQINQLKSLVETQYQQNLVEKNALEKNNQNLQQEVENLQSQVQTGRQELERLQNDVIQAIKCKNDELQQQIMVLQENKNLLEQQNLKIVQSHQEESDKMKEDINTLNEKLANAEEENIQLIQKTANIQAQSQNLIEKVQQQLKAVQTELSEALEKNQQLSTEFFKQRQAAEQLQHRNTQVEIKLQAAESENVEQRLLIEQLKSTKSSLENDWLGKQQELSKQLAASELACRLNKAELAESETKNLRSKEEQKVLKEQLALCNKMLLGKVAEALKILDKIQNLQHTQQEAIQITQMQIKGISQYHQREYELQKQEQEELQRKLKITINDLEDKKLKLFHSEEKSQRLADLVKQEGLEFEQQIQQEKKTHQTAIEENQKQFQAKLSQMQQQFSDQLEKIQQQNQIQKDNLLKDCQLQVKEKQVQLQELQENSQKQLNELQQKTDSALTDKVRRIQELQQNQEQLEKMHQQYIEQENQESQTRFESLKKSLLFQIEQAEQKYKQILEDDQAKMQLQIAERDQANNNQIKELQKQLENANQALLTQQEEQQIKLKELKVAHEHSISELNQKHQLEIYGIQNEHANQLQCINDQNNKQLEQVESTYKNKLQEQDTLNRQELNSEKENNQNKQQELINNFMQQIDQLKKDHQFELQTNLSNYSQKLEESLKNHQDEMEQIKQSFSQLQDETIQKTNQYEQQQLQIQKSQMEGVQKTLIEKANQHQKELLQAMQQDYFTKYEAVHQQLKQKLEESQLLHSEVDNLRKTINSQRNELQILQQRYQKFIEGKFQDIIQLSNQRKDQEADMIQLKLQLQANNVEITSINESLELGFAAKNEQVSQYSETIIGMRKYIEELQQKIQKHRKLQDIVEEKEIESVRLQERIRELNKLREDQLSKINDLEKQNIEQINSFSMNNQQQNQRLLKLDEELENLKSKYSKLKLTKEQLDQKIVQIENQSILYQEKIKELENLLIKEKVKEGETPERCIKVEDQQHQQQQLSFDDFKSKLEEDSSQRGISEISEMHIQSQNQLQQQQQLWQQQQANFNNQIEQLQKQLQVRDEEINKLKAEQQIKQDQLNLAQAKVEELEANFEQAREDNNQKLLKISELSSQVSIEIEERSKVEQILNQKEVVHKEIITEKEKKINILDQKINLLETSVEELNITFQKQQIDSEQKFEELVYKLLTGLAKDEFDIAEFSLKKGHVNVKEQSENQQIEAEQQLSFRNQNEDEDEDSEYEYEEDEEDEGDEELQEENKEQFVDKNNKINKKNDYILSQKPSYLEKSVHTQKKQNNLENYPRLKQAIETVVCKLKTLKIQLYDSEQQIQAQLQLIKKININWEIDKNNLRKLEHFKKQMQTPILKSEHSDDNNISKLDIKPQPINSEEEREKKIEVKKEELLERIEQLNMEVEEAQEKQELYRKENSQLNHEIEQYKKDIKDMDQQEEYYTQQSKIYKEEISQLKNIIEQQKLEMESSTDFQIRGTLKTIFPKFIYSLLSPSKDNEKKNDSQEYREYLKIIIKILNLSEIEKKNLFDQFDNVKISKKGGGFWNF